MKRHYILLSLICLLLSKITFAIEGRYIVKFKDTLKADQDIKDCGGKSERKIDRIKSSAVRLNSESFEKLRKNINVERIEIDHIRYPLALETIPWGINKVQALDPIFDVPTASQGITVCIIDSGYQASHEDLLPIASGLLTGSTDPLSGNWYEDTCGHGTHVAGTISALRNGKGLLGVNSNGKLKLHIEKVFNGSNCGWSYSSDLVAAVDRCLSKVRGTTQKLVINMSLGGVAPTVLEQDIFKLAQSEGAIVVAAAGNSGTSELNYPAGYSSVISVGAIDVLGQKASFSQFNSDVELAAPGVDVFSTTPFKPQSLSLGIYQWAVRDITGSARVDVSAPLVNGDLCLSTNPAWSGKIVLCERGTNNFAEKASNVSKSGGVGAVIYNNIISIFDGSLTPSTSSIPVVSMSQEDGMIARNFINETATLLNSTASSTGFGNGYESYNGTSMATPHVSGVAALIWSLNPTKSNLAVRNALQLSAIDAGEPGRDHSFGFGIIQAKSAHELLKTISDPQAPSPFSLNLSPQSLNFGSIAIGSSQTQTLILTNTGNTNVGLSSIAISINGINPYSLTHTCGSSILAGSSCSISIKFSPTIAQSYSGSLSVSPVSGDIIFAQVTGQSVSPTPSYSVSRTSIAFGNLSINNPSAPSTITVTNTGGTIISLPATWISFSTTGQYSQTNNCATSLVVGASCNINVIFKPTSTGLKTSTLNLRPTGITSKAIAMTGTGVTSVATLSPTSLAFGTLKVNSVSPGKIVTVTNTGTASVSLIFAFTGTALTQFKQTNNCPSSLAAKSSCQVTLAFSPTSIGSKSARLSVTPLGGTAKTVTLTGTGN